MATNYQIEIIGASDESITEESATPPGDERDRQKAADRASQEARRRRADELKESREERARKREERQEESDKRKALEAAAREERRTVLDEERRSNRERKRSLQEERQLMSESRREQTLRRRFINDMFGAFNRAHLGRRVNHAIDFIQSIFSSRPIQINPVGDKGLSSSSSSVVNNTSNQNQTTNSFGNTLSNVLNNASSNSTSTSFSGRGNTSRFVTNVGSLGANVGSNFKPRQNPFALRGSSIAIGGVSGNTAKQAALARGFNASSAVSQSGRAGSIASQFVRGGATAARGGPIALAVVGGLAALGAAIFGSVFVFKRMNRSVDKLSATIDSIPSELTFAKIESDLDNFSFMLRRANKFGSVLGDIERSRNNQKLAISGIQDSIVGPLLPVAHRINQLLETLLNAAEPAIKVITTLSLEPSMFLLEKILFVLNKILELGTSQIETIVSVVEFISPQLGKALRKYLSDGRDDIGMDIIKELYKFLNNDSTDQDEDVPIEFNVGL